MSSSTKKMSSSGESPISCENCPCSTGKCPCQTVLKDRIKRLEKESVKSKAKLKFLEGLFLNLIRSGQLTSLGDSNGNPLIGSDATDDDKKDDGKKKKKKKEKSRSSREIVPEIRRDDNYRGDSSKSDLKSDSKSKHSTKDSTKELMMSRTRSSKSPPSGTCDVPMNTLKTESVPRTVLGPDDEELFTQVQEAVGKTVGKSASYLKKMSKRLAFNTGVDIREIEGILAQSSDDSSSGSDNEDSDAGDNGIKRKKKLVPRLTPGRTTPNIVLSSGDEETSCHGLAYSLGHGKHLRQYGEPHRSYSPAGSVTSQCTVIRELNEVNLIAGVQHGVAGVQHGVVAGVQHSTIIPRGGESRSKSPNLGSRSKSPNGRSRSKSPPNKKMQQVPEGGIPCPIPPSGTMTSQCPDNIRDLNKTTSFAGDVVDNGPSIKVSDATSKEAAESMANLQMTALMQQGDAKEEDCKADERLVTIELEIGGKRIKKKIVMNSELYRMMMGADDADEDVHGSSRSRRDTRNVAVENGAEKLGNKNGNHDEKAIQSDAGSEVIFDNFDAANACHTTDAITITKKSRLDHGDVNSGSNRAKGIHGINGSLLEGKVSGVNRKGNGVTAKPCAVGSKWHLGAKGKDTTPPFKGISGLVGTVVPTSMAAVYPASSPPGSNIVQINTEDEESTAQQATKAPSGKPNVKGSLNSTAKNSWSSTAKGTLRSTIIANGSANSEKRGGNPTVRETIDGKPTCTRKGELVPEGGKIGPVNGASPGQHAAPPTIAVVAPAVQSTASEISTERTTSGSKSKTSKNEEQRSDEKTKGSEDKQRSMEKHRSDARRVSAEESRSDEKKDKKPTESVNKQRSQERKSVDSERSEERTSVEKKPVNPLYASRMGVQHVSAVVSSNSKVANGKFVSSVGRGTSAVGKGPISAAAIGISGAGSKGPDVKGANGIASHSMNGADARFSSHHSPLVEDGEGLSSHRSPSQNGKESVDNDEAKSPTEAGKSAILNERMNSMMKSMSRAKSLEFSAFSRELSKQVSSSGLTKGTRMEDDEVNELGSRAESPIIPDNDDDIDGDTSLSPSQKTTKKKQREHDRERQRERRQERARKKKPNSQTLMEYRLKMVSESVQEFHDKAALGVIQEKKVEVEEITPPQSDYENEKEEQERARS